MGGLLSALNAAKTSLTTNQKVVEIAGNNIANANTPGYSRQNAVLTPYPALNFNGFFIGDGVKVSSVQRQHDVFIANQLLDKNTTLGEENGKSEPLNELQRIFGVSDNNLATQIDKFFGAWQQLSANPSGEVERSQVLQQGDLVAKAFQSSIAEPRYGSEKHQHHPLLQDCRYQQPAASRSPTSTSASPVSRRAGRPTIRAGTSAISCCRVFPKVSAFRPSKRTTAWSMSSCRAACLSFRGIRPFPSLLMSAAAIPTTCSFSSIWGDSNQ